MKTENRKEWHKAKTASVIAVSVLLLLVFIITVIHTASAESQILVNSNVQNNSLLKVYRHQSYNPSGSSLFIYSIKSRSPNVHSISIDDSKSIYDYSNLSSGIYYSTASKDFMITAYSSNGTVLFNGKVQSLITNADSIPNLDESGRLSNIRVQNYTSQLQEFSLDIEGLGSIDNSNEKTQGVQGLIAQLFGIQPNNNAKKDVHFSISGGKVQGITLKGANTNILSNVRMKRLIRAYSINTGLMSSNEAEMSISAFAIDASNASFVSGIISATATGTRLYKCADWNYNTSTCTGNWAFVKNIIPGTEYNITFNATDPAYAETGVSTINTNKSTYHPGENAGITITVLDNRGYPAGAEVSMIVKTPTGAIYSYNTSSADPSYRLTETGKGIYKTVFTHTAISGAYLLNITAEGTDVNSSMQSSFLVSSYYPFDIIRTAPSTVNPWAGSFRSELKAISYNYTGLFNLTEVIPAIANISAISSGLNASITSDGEYYYITWKHIANNSVLGYNITLPLASPDVYTLGKAYVSYGNSTYYEARDWYIAVDPPDTTPPNITLYTPLNNSYSSSPDITLKFTPQDATGLTNCSVYLDGVVNETCLGNPLRYSTNVQAESGIVTLTGGATNSIVTLQHSYNITKAFIIRRYAMYTQSSNSNPNDETATLQWAGCTGEVCNQLNLTRFSGSGNDLIESYSILQADNIQTWNFTLNWVSGQNITSFAPSPSLPVGYSGSCFVNVFRSSAVNSGNINHFAEAEVMSNITAVNNVTFERMPESGQGAAAPAVTSGEVVCFRDTTKVQSVFDNMPEGGPLTVNVPMTSTDLNRSFVIHDHYQPDDGVGQNSIIENLTNSTNLQLYVAENGKTGTDQTPKVMSYIIQFEGNSNSSVNMYRITPTSTDTNLSYVMSSSVNLSRSLLFCYNSMSSGAGTAHTRDYWANSFTSNSTINSYEWRTRTSSQTSLINCWVMQWPKITTYNPTGSAPACLVHNLQQNTLNLYAIPDGLHNWSVTCTDNSTNLNKGSSLTDYFTIDTSPPTVTLDYPSNATLVKNNTLTLKYTPTDSNLKNCTLYGDFSGIYGPAAYNNSPLSGSQGSFTVNVSEGKYLWDVLCEDKAGLTGTALQNYTVYSDMNPPLFYNPIAIPPSPVTYNPSQNYEFNITIYDVEGVTNALLESNFTGTLQNYTMTKHLHYKSIGEAGEFNSSGYTFHMINFTHTYSEPPIIVVVPVTTNANDNNGVVPVINFVNTTSFNVSLCKDNGTVDCEASMPQETANYFVFDRAAISNLSWIETGYVNASTNGGTTPITFKNNYTQVPYIFASPQTDSDGGQTLGPEVWASNPTTSGANIIACTHTGIANTCDTITTEKVGYVVLETNLSEIAGMQFGFRSISNSQWTPITFTPSISNPRIMVMSNSQNGVQNPLYGMATNMTNTGGMIRFCEQDASGVCDTHNAENIMWMAISNGNLTYPNNNDTFTYTRSTLPAGKYDWKVIATDAFTDSAASTTYPYTVLKAASGINLTINGVQTNGTAVQDYNFSINVSLISPASGYVELYINGTRIASGNSPLSVISSISQPGIYNVTAIYNSTQNYTESSITGNLNITLDHTPPDITILSPINNTASLNGSILVVYNTTRITAINNCSLVFNKSIAQSVSLIDNGNNSFFLSSIPLGFYNYTVQCEFNGYEFSNSTRQQITMMSLGGFDGSTTNFTSVNLDNVTGVIFENSTYGRIEFNQPISLSGLNYPSSLIHILHNNIGINTALDSRLNKSANITFYNLSYQYNPILYADGTPCPAAQCAIISYTRGNLTVQVSHFTNYTTGINSNMTIYDSSDTLGGGNIEYTNSITRFFANYTNSTSGVAITGAVCTLGLSGGNYAMSYNSTLLEYEYATTIATAGNYNWNVTCDGSSLGFYPLQLTDNITIYNHGKINASLVFPASPINVSKNNFFNFTINISCVGGYCERINATLDPMAPWISNKWKYREQINISENSGSALTNFQVNLTIDTATPISVGHMKSDCSDIRFADSSGNMLQYYLMSGCNTANTKIWVKTNLTANSISSLYMYYGNSNATSASSGTNTFELFGDFTGSSLTPDWTSTVIANGGGNDATGSVSVTGGQLNITNNLGNDIWTTVFEGTLAYQNQQVSSDYIAVARIISQTNTNAWAKSGIMSLNSITAAANNGESDIATTPGNGITYQYQTTGGGTIAPDGNSNGGTYAMPEYLMLQKVGSTTAGYYSNDGTTWTQQGTTSTVGGLASNQYVTLFATTHNNANNPGSGVFSMFYVRKYASTMPTVTTISSEQNVTKGIIPMFTGTPFYTITQNPATNSTFTCLSGFSNSSSCEITWEVNATGYIGDTWTFYAYAQDITGINYTKNVNVTIIGNTTGPNITAAQINTTIINQSETVRLNASITDQTYITSAFATIKYPNTTLKNFSMTEISPGQYALDFADTIKTGLYNFTKLTVYDQSGLSSELNLSLTFNVTPSPPSPFSLLSPANDTQSTNNYPNLTWEQPYEDHFDNYTVQISISPSFSTLEFSYKISQIGNTSLLLPVPLLNNTKYYWRVKAFDIFGNERDSSQNFTYITDKISPQVSLKNPYNGALFTTQSITFRYIPKDTNTIQNCSLYGNFSGIWGQKQVNTTIANGNNNTFSQTIPDGVYKWNIACIDKAGNTAFNDTNYTLYVDSTPPVVQLQYPANDSTINTTNNILFGFNTTDAFTGISQCILIVNGTQKGNPIYTPSEGVIINDTQFLNNGFYNWSVNCTDNSGNTGSSEMRVLNVSVTFEQDPPLVDLNYPLQNNYTSSSSVSFNYTPQDATGIANCSLYIDGTLNESNATAINNNNPNYFSIFGLSEAKHNWSVSCYDTGTFFEGNSTVRNITVDLTNPTVTLDEPLNYSFYTKKQVTFNFTPVDTNLVKCILYGNFSGIFNAVQNITSPVSGVKNTALRNISDGTYAWQVECLDKSGRQGFSQNYTVLVDANAPQFQSIGINPASPTYYNVSALYVFNTTLTEPFPDKVLFESNFSGILMNYSAYRIIGNTYGINFTGLSVGNYDFRFIANDTLGRINNTQYYSYSVYKSLSLLNLYFNGTESNYTINDSGDVNITAIMSKPSGYYITIYKDGTMIKNSTSPSSIVKTFNIPGTYNITATAPGNENYSSGYITRYIKVKDTIAPLVSLIYPGNNTTVGSLTVALQYNVSDAGTVSSCRLYLNGAANTINYGVSKDTLQSFTKTLSEGNYTWQVRCIDQSGNTGLSEIRSVQILKGTGLKVNVTTGKKNYEIGDNALLKWKTLDSFGGITAANTSTAVIYASDNSTTGAVWFNSSWPYRRLLYVQENNNTNLTDFEVNVSINTASLISAGKMNSNCTDIRFANAKGTELPYFIQSGCNSAATQVWIKLNLTAGNLNDFYMYYGNNSATNVSNASATFTLYGDFSGTSLPGGWTYTVIKSGGGADATGSVSVSGGNLSITNNRGNDVWQGVYEATLAYQNKLVTGDYIAEARILSQTNTNVWAKSGILATNTIAATTSNGEADIATTPGNGITWQYQGTGTYVAPDLNSNGGTFTFPTYLRLTRIGNTMSGYYSTDGITYTQQGTSITPTGLGTGQYITLFTTTHNSANNPGSGVYDYFRVRKYIQSSPNGTLGSTEQHLIAYYKNTTNLVTGTNYTLFDTSGQSFGNYSVVTLASAAGVSQGYNSSYFTIVPDTTPPNITLISPSNASDIPIGTVNFTYKPFDINLDACSLYINGQFNETDYSPLNNATSTFSNIPISAGSYNWSVYCNDTYANSKMSSNFSFTAFDPVITFLSITPTQNISLTAANSTTVYCNATFIGRVDNVTGYLYGYNSSYYNNDNNYTHYTNSSCENTGSGFSCSFSLRYYAINGTWNCMLNATNPLNSSAQSNSTMINPLIAVGVNQSVINFLNVSPTNVSQVEKVLVTNYGNIKMGLNLYGYGSTENDGQIMNCSSNYIPANYQRFSLGSLLPFDSMTNLSDNSATPNSMALNLPTGEQSVANVTSYWQLKVPEPLNVGQCQGHIVFVATPN